MINIGFYVDNIGNQQQMKNVAECVNKSVLCSHVEDVSIFYDDIGYNPIDIKCGFFNSTDLWHFNGTLITTSIETTKNALNIVNKIDVIYLYDKEEKVNIFSLILMAQNNNIKIVCKDNESAKELYRITNTTPYGVSDLDNILNLVGA